MTGASILIGAALALVTAAFLARPFRAARNQDLTRSIERWVGEARSGHSAAVAVADPASDVARFCRQCGRSLAPDSRFCSGCGTPVEGPRP